MDHVVTLAALQGVTVEYLIARWHDLAFGRSARIAQWHFNARRR
jgi:hypothetical protein